MTYFFDDLLFGLFMLPFSIDGYLWFVNGVEGLAIDAHQTSFSGDVYLFLWKLIIIIQLFTASSMMICFWLSVMWLYSDDLFILFKRIFI
jgi:hypothetical protein